MEIRAAPPEHWPWLLQRIGLTATPSFRAIESVSHDGTILGMVGYDCWTHNMVQLHVALDSKIALRKLIPAAFYYPFTQLKYGVLLCIIAASNEPSMRLVRKLGFRETHRVRDGHSAGTDLVMFEMRREECRWLGAK